MHNARDVTALIGAGYILALKTGGSRAWAFKSLRAVVPKLVGHNPSEEPEGGHSPLREVALL